MRQPCKEWCTRLKNGMHIHNDLQRCTHPCSRTAMQMFARLACHVDSCIHCCGCWSQPASMCECLPIVHHENERYGAMCALEATVPAKSIDSSLRLTPLPSMSVQDACKYLEVLGVNAHQMWAGQASQLQDCPEHGLWVMATVRCHPER